MLATGGFSGRTHLIARTLAASVPGGVWAITHNGAAIWDPAGRLVDHRPMPAAAVETALASAGRRLWVTYEAVHGAEPAGGEQRRAAPGVLRRPPAPGDRHVPVGPPDAAGGPGRGPGRPPGGSPSGSSRAGTGAGPDRPASTATAPCSAAGASARRWAWPPWTPSPGRGTAGWRAPATSPGASASASSSGGPDSPCWGGTWARADASKGAAAGWLCDRLGIDRAQTAAFGDADNDVELLAFAGFAVVMANATPQVLPLGDLVAPTNREDGVARVLRDWLRARPGAAPAAGG